MTDSLDVMQQMAQSMSQGVGQGAAQAQQGAASMVPLQDDSQDEQQQAPKPPRMGGLPNIVQLIGGMINPNSPRFNPTATPGRPSSRADVFENFIGNFLGSMAQGLSQAGTGPGANLRGFAGAVTAPYQRDLQQFQMQRQAAQDQARLEQTQAQTAATQTQSKLVPYQPDGPGGRTIYISQKDVAGIIKSGIGAKSKTDAAEIGARAKLGAAQLQVEATMGRLAQMKPSINPATGKAEYEMFDRAGKSMGFAENTVVPSLMTKTSDTVQYMEDADGTIRALPKKTVRGVQIPTPQSSVAPQSPKTSLQSKVPALGAGQPPAAASGRPVMRGKGSADMGVAYDPQTNTRLWTTRGEAQQNGYQQFAPGGRNAAATMEKDRTLNVRLGDVEQKISEYSKAMSNDLSPSDNWTMARVMAEVDKTHESWADKVPGVGAEIGILNQLEKSGNLKGLSPAAQTRLLAYVNAREAMNGYARVLAGSGQSNEMALKLNLDVIPNPMVDKGYAANAFNQFRQNLDTVSQGLPRIRGIKSPAEFRQAASETKSYKGVTYTKGPDGQWHR